MNECICHHMNSPYNVCLYICLFRMIIYIFPKKILKNNYYIHYYIYTYLGTIYIQCHYHTHTHTYKILLMYVIRAHNN